MLRVILLISVLYTARATPASGDRPSPSQYTVREEKIEFGNSALEGGVQTRPYEYEIGGSDDYEIGGSDDYEIGGSDDYEIGGSDDYEIGGSDDYEIGGSDDYEYPYDGYVYAEHDYVSDDGMTPFEIDKLIDSLEMCEENEDGPVIMEEGCIYFDDEGNVHLFQVFVEDIDDAVKVLEKAGFEKCDMDGYKPLIPVGGCAYASEGGVHFMGVYKKEEGEKPETLPDVIGQVRPCRQIEGEPLVPPGGCVWFDDEANIHLLNVLDDTNREDAMRVLQNSKYYRECVMEEDGPIVPKGGCILVYGSSIHILGMQEHYVEHNEDEDNDEEKISNVVEKLNERKTAGKIQLQKALFKRRSDDLAQTSITQKQNMMGQKAHKTARKPKSGPRARRMEKGTKSSHKNGNW